MTRQSATLTRLDKAIRRLQAQRRCLNWVISEIVALPGPILELGLGNGRTYDHLCAHLPGRDIYVFERKVQAHPDSVPPANRLIIGDLKTTLPSRRRRFAGKAAFVHSDIGTGNDARNRRVAAWLGPQLRPLLRPSGIIASDQELEALAEWAAPLPPGVQEGRYYLYRAPRAGAR